MHKFFRTRISALLMLAVTARVTLISSPAEADTLPSCSVTAVAWATSDGATLQVFCSGTGYWAFGSSPTCPSIDIDTRKAWLSLAQTALLTGKTLTLGYAVCTNGPGITFMLLNK